INVNGVNPGAITGGATVCSGADPGGLNSAPDATVPPGATLSYQWQRNNVAGSNCGNDGDFSNIGGATSPTYDPPAGLTVTTIYRRVATSLLNGVPCSAVSNCVTVSVNNVNSGVVATPPAVCAGVNPPAFVVTTPASGSGTITYQWSFNTTGCGSPTWTTAPGALGQVAAYDPPARAVTTYYRRITTSTLNGQQCTDEICVVLTVSPSIAPTIGVITQPSCTVQTGSVELTGLPAGNWTINPGNISGSGTTTTIGGLTPNTTYTYTVTNAAGCTSPASAPVNIDPAPQPPVVTLPGAGPLCINAAAVQLNGTPAGGTYSGTGVNATGLFNPTTAGAGAHIITYTFTNAGGCTNTATTTINVSALPVVALPGAGPLCINDAAVQLNGTPAGGTYSGTGVNA
ncbi:MAG: hypothetical protein ABL869_12510, partial [Candidatus Nitrotoga sp.]